MYKLTRNTLVVSSTQICSAHAAPLQVIMVFLGLNIGWVYESSSWKTKC